MGPRAKEMLASLASIGKSARTSQVTEEPADKPAASKAKGGKGKGKRKEK